MGNEVMPFAGSMRPCTPTHSLEVARKKVSVELRWILNTERDDELHVTKASARRTQVDDNRESGSESSYLVDPASSHMLVSKIKPCMSKYKQLYGETANGSLNQL